MWLTVELITGVRIPREAVCDGHSAPFDAFAEAYFATSSMAVWKASRGFGGKSMLLALLGFIEEIFLGARIAILGGSGEQSMRVHAYQAGWWEQPTAPRYLLASDTSKRRTALTHGGSVTCLMASRRSVRGIHPERLRLDEIDEMALDIFDGAMGQTMRRPRIAAQTVASSTHQHPDGTMTEVLKRAVEKGWSVHEWCYKESMTEWLDVEEVTRKRGEVTDAMWNAEYELQEPNVSGRAIVEDKVKEMFKKELGEFVGLPDELIEIEAPVPEGRYSHGADWAQRRDWTVITTWRIDRAPWRLVSYLRTGRKPWPDMVAAFDERIRRYGGNALHDQTGIGGVVNDLLTEVAEGMTLGGAPRHSLITGYIASIERQELEAPFIRYMYDEHRLATQNDLYGTGHLPDTICSAALGVQAGLSSAGSWETVAASSERSARDSAIVKPRDEAW